MTITEAEPQSREGTDSELLGTTPPAASETINATITAQLQALEAMSYATLRAEWRRLYRVLPPKRVARELLLLGVAWKIQEQGLGGLGAATKRSLAALTRTLERNGDVTRDRVVQLKPGAKLVREWHGKTHMVLVLEEGFEWRAKRWRSLTEIAQAISGAHWSGPRFFGLRGKARRTSREASRG
jgi:hypothetical protein